jgi:NADPH-dependent 2,4-dienoyl-CoA reductase/sulfur reductase-like enzyme
MSAASRARRLRPDVEIVVFEKGGDVSYSACLLPYFVSGLIPSREKLVQYEADFFRNERHMDIRLNTPVTALDPVGRRVTFQGPDGGNASLSFDALVLGTGAVAVKPPLPGIDIPGVATLRTLADGESLRERVESGGVGNATIVGAGYIGLEMAEALASRGITVTVIELLPTVLPTFDPDMSELVERELPAPSK